MSNAINDWKKSISGQKGQKRSKKEKPRSTPKGLVGASKLISEFIERNMNTEFINRILKELQQENHQSISDLFTAKNACYHDSCILYIRLLLINHLKIQEVVTSSEVANREAAICLVNVSVCFVPKSTCKKI